MVDRATMETVAKAMAVASGHEEKDLDLPFKEETSDSRAIHHEKLWHMFAHDALKLIAGLKALGVKTK
jgi:hypothetical protein